METSRTQSSLYGLVAEFSDADTIIEAAGKARAAGYRFMDAYTPFPVHGLDEALEFHDAKVPWMIFIAGCLAPSPAIACSSLRRHRCWTRF